MPSKLKKRNENNEKELDTDQPPRIRISRSIARRRIYRYHVRFAYPNHTEYPSI